MASPAGIRIEAQIVKQFERGLACGHVWLAKASQEGQRFFGLVPAVPIAGAKARLPPSVAVVLSRTHVAPRPPADRSLLVVLTDLPGMTLHSETA